MSTETCRKMKALVVIAMLAVAEAQQVQQNIRMNAGHSSNNVRNLEFEATMADVGEQMQSLMGNVNLQEGIVKEQMEAIMADPNFRIKAQQFAEQLNAMVADSKLQEQVKVVAEQMEEIKANPSFHQETSRIAEQMEAMMANKNPEEQGKVFAEEMAKLTTSPSFKEQVNRVTEQVEAILANPNFLEKAQLFAEKMKADPVFQEQEKHLAKLMEGWTQPEAMATKQVDFVDRIADNMIDGLFDSALRAFPLASSASRLSPASSKVLRSQFPSIHQPLSASHSFGASPKLVSQEQYLPVHVPRAAAAVAAPSALTFFLEQVAPRLGTVIANVMFFASVPPVLEARKNKDLGELNPIPFVVTVGNCMAWVAYGLLVKNPYVLLSNAPGVLLGLFYTMTAVKLADDSTRTTLEGLLLVFVGLMLGSGFVSSLVLKDMATRISIAGYLANAIVFLYYGSPLSTLGSVIKEKSSASLNAAQIGINVLNGGFWTGYGLTVKDMYIAVPNGVGVILGAIQLFFCAIFPSKKKEA